MALLVAALVAGLAAPVLLMNRPSVAGRQPLQPPAAPGTAPTKQLFGLADEIASRTDASELTPAVPESAAQTAQAVAPVRLRLVEVESRRAVSFFSVGLERGDEVLEILESDADGMLESSQSYPTTSFQVRLLDVPDSPRERAEFVGWDHDDAVAAPAELAIRCGPTYRLSLDAPGPIVMEDLRAELRPQGSAVSEDLEPWTRVRVHSGAEGVWTRIPLQAITWRLGIRSWDLRVGDASRGWSGEAPVQSAVAGCLEDVTVTLSGTQSLSGHVAEPSGAVVAGARITLLLVTDTGRSKTAAVAIADAAGSYRFEGLTPGSYRVGVRTDAHQPFHGSLEVGPLEPTTRDFVLEPAEFGVVEGALRGADAAEVERVSAVLYPRGVGGDVRQQRLTSEPGPDGTTLGTFRFEDVLSADWVLRLHGLPPGAIEPESIELRPPSVALEFRRIDLGPLQSYGFLVSSAVDGSELPYHSCWFEDAQGKALASASDAERGVAPLRDWPERAAFEWIVESPGFQPAFGTSSAFTIRNPPVLTPRGQRLRARGIFAEVPLRPGWGTRVLVRGPDGALPEAAVLLDGLEVAKTDAQGRAWALAEQAPARIEARNADWPPVSLTVDLDRPNPVPGSYGYELTLRPR
ncbi:MAG TPA: carboxypeptidase-like regulatory domain-containing protein [Planctomycetota bacterium]|nr:carboxypeptidase-like regulatory domain-containing protein [Planctomycetota bacterium]